MRNRAFPASGVLRRAYGVWRKAYSVKHLLPLAASCRLLAVSCLLVSLAHADYTKTLNTVTSKLAQELAKNCKGCTVVVFNILRGGNQETHLAVDLATKLSLGLYENSKKNFTVLLRPQGERLAYEEFKYTARFPNSKELARLLENFKASVGVTGSYTVVGRKLVMDNICAQKIPSPDRPPVIVGSFKHAEITLDSTERSCIAAQDQNLPLPDSTTRFLLDASNTSSDYSPRASIVGVRGKRLESNCAPIGDTYRLSVELPKESFLYVLSYDQDRGIVYLLRPLARQTQPLKAGRVLVPDPDEKIGYVAIGPAGENFVMLFASQKPIELSVPSSQDYVLDQGQVEAFVKSLKEKPQEEWGGYRIFVTVRQ